MHGSAAFAFHWPLSLLEHGAFVLAGLLIYLTSTRLSHQHRHPSAALAWVLIIVLLPYLAIPLYFLFGVRKVPRPGARKRPHRTVDATRPAAWTHGLAAALALPTPTHNEQVRFHEEGQAALDALLTLIQAARASIDVCTFVLGNDPVARQLSDALCQAARRGVRVRVLLDELGCWSTSRQQIRALRQSGVIVQFFMPVLPNIRRGRVNLRNHRKLLIADGQKVWSGGRNLATEYFLPQGSTPAWRDLSFVVCGPLARQAQALYQQDWQVASGDIDWLDQPLAASTAQAPGPRDGAQVQWVPSGPDHADDTIYAMLLAGAYRAERHITLVTPYFVPDDALLAAWSMACRRGVKLTLVIPARSNHRLADLARAPSLRTLIGAGADVRLHPGMLHAKAAIMDDSLALCGSVNLDSRSLFLNYELSSAFYSPDEINWLKHWAHGLAQASQGVTLKPPSALRELIEGLVRVVGFQL